MPTIIDISPPLTPTLAVWPGDEPLRRQVTLDLHRGDHLTLSSLAATVHLGAHADAPSHYAAHGPSIEQLDLTSFLGPCQVLTVAVPKSGLITAAHCAPALRAGAKRLLLRTLTCPHAEVFNEDFAALAPEAVRAMGEAGVLLVGIDTPSVDPFASKDLAAHAELWRWGIRNLEGLRLDHVADGEYELIALPLPLVGFDASPVRAVLRPLAAR